MAAVATQILTAVEAIAKGAFPKTNVLIRRNDPNSPMRAPSDSLPMIAVTIGEEESVEIIERTRVIVSYPLWVTYFKSKAASSPSPTDDPEIRTFREKIRLLLNTWPQPGMPDLNEVRPGARTPLDSQSNDKNVVASTMTFTMEILENRSN